MPLQEITTVLVPAVTNDTAWNRWQAMEFSPRSNVETRKTRSNTRLWSGSVPRFAHASMNPSPHRNRSKTLDSSQATRHFTCFRRFPTPGTCGHPGAQRRGLHRFSREPHKQSRLPSNWRAVRGLEVRWHHHCLHRLYGYRPHSPRFCDQCLVKFCSGQGLMQRRQTDVISLSSILYRAIVRNTLLALKDYIVTDRTLCALMPSQRMRIRTQ